MLSGLELTFMGGTWSNSGLFRAPGFIVSPVGKGERRKKKKPSAGFKLVTLVVLVFLSVKGEGVGGGIGFTFLPS